MKNANKLIGTVLAVALLPVFPTTCANAAVAVKSTAPAISAHSAPTYVARVGYGQISKAEYAFFLMDAKSRVQSYMNGNVDWKSSKIQDKPAGEFAKQIALDNAVNFKIQLVKIKEAKLTLTKEELTKFDSDVKNYLDSISAKPEEQESYIKTQTGLSLSQFKGLYRNLYLVNKFTTDTKNSFNLTDAELQTYYNANKDLYFKATVAHILFMTKDSSGQDLSQEKQAEVKKKAEDTLAKVNAPNSDFAALVKELSEDTGSKDTGGEYTVQKNNEFVQEFQDWATDPARKVGDTGIIKTTYGYHIMKMNKIFSFDDLKNDIKSDYTAKKYQDLLSSWKNDKNCKLIMNKSVYDTITVS